MKFMDDGRTTSARNGGEPLAAQRNLPQAQSSSVNAEPVAAERALSVSDLVEHCEQEIQTNYQGEPSSDTYGVELLRRATIGRDLEVWISLQQCLTEGVQSWLRAHPSKEVALRLDSEESYVAQAFERFWWATTQSQQIQFRTFADALQYLRASLNGALLDTMRAYIRPKEIPLPEPSEAGEPCAE